MYHQRTVAQAARCAIASCPLAERGTLTFYGVRGRLLFAGNARRADRNQAPILEN
jgi:hypothetical protein